MIVPDTYYDQLRENLKHSKVKITEDLNVLQVRNKMQTLCFEVWSDSIKYVRFAHSGREFFHLFPKMEIHFS